MAYSDPKLYRLSVAAANRRDVPVYTNTTGALLSAVAWAADGNRKGWARYDSSSDISYWEIEATNSTTVTVRSKTKLGDDLTTTGVTVAASTTYTSIIPGVSITMAGTITTGHISRVYAADYLTDADTVFCPRDQAGDNIKFIYENPGTTDHMLVYVIVGRGTYFEHTSGTPLDGFRSTVVNPTADTYAVTIADGSVSGKEVTFTGTYNTYVVDNVALGSTANAIGASGLTFDLDAAAGNTDTATCYVTDMADAVELAPDSAGTPGTWVTWNATLGVKLGLSRPGYSDLLVPAGQTITFWARLNPAVTHTLGRANARMYASIQRAE